MVDDACADPPLRLRAFARIVDDEGIDLRHRPGADFGKAILRQRDRLARQPFQIAMLAHMDDRMRAKFPVQPDMEGEVAMRRRQRRVMIAALGIDVIAARRLHRDCDMAEAMHPQAKGPILTKWVALRLAPPIRHGPLHPFGQARKCGPIHPQRQRAPLFAARHMPHQRRAIGRRIANHIASLTQRLQDRRRAFRRVQPHAIADPSIPVRIIGKHERNPPVLNRLPRQFRPIGRELRNEPYTIQKHLRHDYAAFRPRIKARRRLESDRPREDPPVHLGQGNMHRQIARPQSSCAVLPHRLFRTGEQCLKDGAVRLLQYRRCARLARRGRGKGGGVQDDVRPNRRHHPLQKVPRKGFPQRPHMHRQHIQASFPQPADHRVHRFQCPRDHQRTIEKEQHHRLPLCPASLHLIQHRTFHAGQI